MTYCDLVHRLADVSRDFEECLPELSFEESSGFDSVKHPEVDEFGESIERSLDVGEDVTHYMASASSEKKRNVLKKLGRFSRNGKESDFPDVH